MPFKWIAVWEYKLGIDRVAGPSKKVRENMSYKEIGLSFKFCLKKILEKC